MRLLEPHFRRHRRRYALGALCIVGAVGLRLLVPHLLGRSIDLLRSLESDAGASAARVRGLLVSAALIIVVASAAGALVRTWSRLLILGGSRRVVHDVRAHLFDHLLRLSPSFYVREQTGGLMSRCVNDVQFVQGLTGPVVMYLAETAALFAVCLFFLLSTHAGLSLCGLLPFPLFLWGARRLAGRIQQKSRESQQSLQEVSSKVEESLSGQMVVKTLVLEEFDRQRFSRHCEEYRALNLELARQRGSLQALMTGLSSLSSLIVLAIGGPLVARGSLSLGDFVAVMLYLHILAGPISVMGFVLSSLQRGTAALARVRELLEEQPALRDPPQPATRARPAGELDVRRLSVTLRNEKGQPRAVLQDVSFHVPPGTMVGVIGPTGAGKTTLLRALARQLEIEPGQVFLDGADLTELRLAEARQAIGYVPQETFLFSTTLAENVALGAPGATPAAIAAAVAAARLSKDLGQFPHGLDTLVGERGLSLSGGQRQRAALARVLLCDPQVLVLDDPFSAVDAETTEEILGELRVFCRGRTVVLTAHRAATLRYADQILVLRDGRVAERGSHAELLAIGGWYAALYRRQQRRARLAAGLQTAAVEEGRR